MEEVESNFRGSLAFEGFRLVEILRPRDLLKHLLAKVPIEILHLQNPSDRQWSLAVAITKLY